MKYIKNFKEINKNDVAIAGGKGASLGEMINSGIPVPDGFVILSNAFEEFLKETDLSIEIDSELSKVNHEEIHTIENASETIKALILSKDIPEKIKLDIIKAYKELDSNFVAVRSSATSEDSSSAAWAGQLESYLNTTKDDLYENIKKCWASLFTPRAIFYRFEKKLHKEKVSVAVVVQKMIESEESGIAFSVHPVTQDYNQLIIEAGYGLGEAIVSGQVTPDSYVVLKDSLMILDKNISEQKKGLYRNENGGNIWKEIGEKGKKQVLTEKEIIELTNLIIKIEKHYNFPVDVEWAKEKGKFYIVQSRPITTLSGNMPTQKILINPQSREHSLLYFYIYHKANQVDNKDFFKSLKNLLFLNKGFGKTEVWYDADEVDENIKQNAIRANNEENYFNKTKNEFFKFYKNLIEYQNNKKIYTLDDLKEYYKAYINWWSPMAVIYGLAGSKLADKKIRKEALEIRSETEKNSDQNDLFFIERFNKLYPEFKEISYLMTPDEIFNCEKLKDFHIEKIKKRHKGYVLYNGNIFSLEDLDNIVKQNNLVLQKEKIHSTDEIFGQASYKGVVKGRVKLILSKKQLSTFKEGEILVTEMTSPDYVPYMKKASAIITDEGGINSHASIVSRELKIPCIIGTKIATQVLHDGDYVEVDANKGIVRIIERAGEKKEEKKNDINKLKLYKQEIKSGIFQLSLPAQTVTKTMLEYFPISYDDCWIYWKDDHAIILLQDDKMRDISETFFKNYEGKFPKDWEILWKKFDKKISFISNKISKLNLSKLTKKDLMNYYNDLFENNKKMWGISIFIDALDAGYDQEEIIRLANKYSFNEDEIRILLLPKEQSYITEYVNDLYKYSKNKISFKKIKEKYFWIKTDYSSSLELDEDLIKKESKNSEYNKKEDYSKKQIKILKNHNLKKDPLKSFRILTKWRDDRKRLHFMGVYGIIRILNEIFKRNNLIEGNIDELLLKKRKENSVLLHVKNNGEYEIKEGIYADKEFKEKEKFLPNTSEEIKGFIANKGNAKGIVRIVKNIDSKSAKEFQNGDILVSSMTRPEFVQLMKKSGAIITNEGGISCHAAIISREMNKPCIIGTKIATEVLHDGDYVEVDANNGIVRILNKSGDKQ